MARTCSNGGAICTWWYPSFLRGCESLEYENNKKTIEYVEAKEYLRDKLENEVRHQKHEKEILELQKDRNFMLSNLEKLPKAIEGLDKTVQQIDRKMFESEYGYDTLTGRIDIIERMQQSKKTANTKIIVAIISAIALLGGSALTFAEIFFK